MGNPASDVVLPDTIGTATGLYDLKADYALVVFWDPTCGHRARSAAKTRFLYVAKWKAAGLKIFAVAKETDGNKADWLNFYP